MTSPKPRAYLTQDQQTTVVRLIKKMITRGKYMSEIKSAIAAEYHLSRRSVERYMTRARREMREFVEQDVEFHRAESFYFYRSVLENSESTPHECLRARERIDKILGVEIPYKFHLKKRRELTVQQVQNMSDEELQAAYDKMLKEFD